MLRERKPPTGQRTASGRISRSKAAQAARKEDIRANNLKVRARELGISFVQAANPAVVSNITFLRKFISARDASLTIPQVQSAAFMEESYSRYAKAINSPAAIFEGGGNSAVMPSEDALDRAAMRAVAVWREIELVLDRAVGKSWRVRVINMVVRGERDERAIKAVRRGLDAVDAHFRMEGKSRLNNK